MRQAPALLALLLLTVFSTAPRAEDAAEAEYQAARTAYYALKEDAQRRKFRHNWQNVARRFESVAKKHPRSRRAPDALFTAAELLRELSRISFLEEDLRQAINHYEQLLADYPKSTLADDGALALAHLYVERLGEPLKARQVVDRALEELPKGDMHGKLVALDAALPQSASPRPTGKKVVKERVARADPKPAPAVPREEGPGAGQGAGTAVAESAPSLLEAIARTARAPEGTAADPGVPAAPKKPAEAEAEAVAVAGAAPTKPAPEAAPATKLPETGPTTRPGATASASPSASAEKTEAPGPETSAPTEAVAAASAPEAKEPPKPDPKAAKERLGQVAKSGEVSEVTLAEQLGLKVRRVVIDAGHGGHDTGAIGKKGTREKDITLLIARRVGDILTEAGLEVILTRDDDTYLRLEDRTRIANEAKGDLFISIHCNAAESRKVRGIETFTLNVASDRYSIRLAARENAASEQSMSDLQFILADLATKANTEESERLARRVQSAMVSKLRPKYAGVQDLGTKQALFYVLLGAKMPAILVETSFLSHPEEEQWLASKAYQEDLAQAIAGGVQGFLEDRQRVAKVQ